MGREVWPAGPLEPPRTGLPKGPVLGRAVGSLGTSEASGPRSFPPRETDEPGPDPRTRDPGIRDAAALLALVLTFLDGQREATEVKVVNGGVGLGILTSPSRLLTTVIGDRSLQTR